MTIGWQSRPLKQSIRVVEDGVQGLLRHRGPKWHFAGARARRRESVASQLLQESFDNTLYPGRNICPPRAEVGRRLFGSPSK
jgi:hypothetical protein